MPVDFDEYTESEEYDHWLRPGSNAHTILSFLAEYPDQGFTPTEIQAEVDIPMGSIGPTLQRLEERDLVRHKDTYWAIAEDDRITGFESTINSVRAVSEHDDEWGDIDWDTEAADKSEIESWRESQTDE
ncbi:helix-turn-helix transcriptional regulator [Halosimplex rubrum]|uniref:Helix-turn-helix transcriptional regulator n=1 Tax=Halosimplex rubrum TaxID=869889 RepID=A0A7D5NYZ7_9EURY|nr:helix-turn-helix transcriptional regulator [Halosimplex rubrum]QLH76903.1 helix-turn-helix transcriptional regulator [Halosimplex rubrum]